MHWATKSVFRVRFTDTAYDPEGDKAHDTEPRYLMFVGNDDVAALKEAKLWASKHRPTWSFVGIRKARTPVLYPDGAPSK